MTTAVSFHLFCIFIIGILLFGMYLQRKTADRLSRKFTVLLCFTLAYLSASLVSELLEGQPELSSLSYAVNWLAFLFVDLVVLSFIGYLKALTEASSGKRSKLLNVAVLLCLVRAVLIFILTVSGKMFAIEDGYYVEKPLGFLPYVCSGVIMLYIIAVAFLNRRCFTRQQFTVIVLYQILPIVPLVAEMYTNVYSLTGAAITVSILLIYIFIQAANVEKSKMRESVLLEISTTDLLTGLNNRRAYYTRLAAVEPSETVGVLFCDINGLKYTNDHFGHAAGDTLIRDFAAQLTAFFPKKDVYRISGDEFVVILPADGNDGFTEKAAHFHTAVHTDKPIAAVGYAFGTGICVERLLAEAETEMYADKATCPNRRHPSESGEA